MKTSMPLPLSALTLKTQNQKALPNQNNISDKEKLREAADEFESIFIQQMLKTMGETSIESDLLPKSEGEKVFQSMLDEQYSKMSAKSGSLGLGDLIYNQFKTNLEE